MTRGIASSRYRWPFWGGEPCRHRHHLLLIPDAGGSGLVLELQHVVACRWVWCCIVNQFDVLTVESEHLRKDDAVVVRDSNRTAAVLRRSCVARIRRLGSHPGLTSWKTTAAASVSAASAWHRARKTREDEQYSVRGDILEQLHHAVGKLSLTHAVPEASPRLFGNSHVWWVAPRDSRC